MRNAAIVPCLLVLICAGACAQTPSSDPYRDEPYVFEHYDTTIRMKADGTGETFAHVVIHMLSEGTARQFSVLSLPYASANSTGNIDYVRVRKADGTVVETPTADAMEMPAAVSREAPLYSDLKEKHLPVRSLASGDTLEYQFHTLLTRAEAPGQFWGAEHFIVSGGVVLSQTLTLQVPTNTYVQVWSPRHPATLVDKDGMRTWTWSSSQTKPSSRNAEGKMTAAEVKDPDEDEDGRKIPSVGWTTFHSWAQVGDWYRTLSLARAEPTAAIRTKADDLTKDAKSPEDQVRALYRYVATQTRYVGIDLGVGRYQPHAAADVLANQYGDCKDKDTLLESLLKAKGLTTAPALIGVGITTVPELPTPAVFNHVITTVDLPGGRTWLDTTPEVAPYRVLLPQIRDQQALVVPMAAAASLVKTPADPPYPYLERFDADATLAKDGLLKSHMNLSVRSDGELGYRVMLQRAAPAQWDDMTQYISNLLGFGGKVSNADFRQKDPAGPVLLAYEYSRPDYADWANGRILALLPVLEVTVIDKEKAPEHDIDLGAPRTLEAHTSIALPPGYRAALPDAIHVKRAYSTADQTYRFADGKVMVDRVVVIRQQKVPKAEWKDYLAFVKEAGWQADEKYIGMIPPAVTSASAKDKAATPAVAAMPAAGTPTASALVDAASVAFIANDWNTVREKTEIAKRNYPHAEFVQGYVGFVAEHDGKLKEAIAAYKAEIAAYPDSTGRSVEFLARLYLRQKRPADAVALLRPYESRDHSVQQSLLGAAELAMNDNATALAMSNAILSRNPDNYGDRTQYANLLLRMHRNDDAAAAAVHALDGNTDANLINSNAYILSETKLELPLAESSSRKSVRMLEDATAACMIDAVNAQSFRDSDTLVAAWDTLGYILVLQRKAADAEVYIGAAWFSQPLLAVGNHLAQVRELQDRPSDALTLNELALATDGAANGKDDYAEVQRNIERLKKAGAKSSAGNAKNMLQEQRTFHVKRPAEVKGYAVFRMQLAGGGVYASMLTSGEAALKPMTTELNKLKMPGAVPAGSSARILRDAVVSCSAGDVECLVVFMPQSGLGFEGI